MKSRSSLTFLVLCLGFVPSATRADDLAQRVEIARAIVKEQPVRPQIEDAVESYVHTNLVGYSEEDRQIFKKALLNVMKPKALEKATIDAYASTYTLPELQALHEYLKKPEAKSAASKQKEFAGKVTPEIIRMMDQALIRLRTAGQKP